MLDSPILYLSRFIIKNKSRYYELLQNVHNSGKYNEWIEFFVDGIIETANSAVILIKNIKQLMDSYLEKINQMILKRPRDFIDYIFVNPFVSRKKLQEHLQVSYPTLLKYLGILESAGIVHSIEIQGVYYYVNHQLLDLLSTD